ncbi:MAG: putrescine aminotransferase [Armatimonadetes bacterium 55-13]|nr:aspartate aminotransferase family protein [Armatimonadota bacterium]OJU64828.1 MAG: putrescine aminotransferase [Armatimonadetes bacterium 55-13]
MDADALFADVVDKYSKHVNPYLAKLLQFAGFGVEMKGEGCYVWDQDGKRYLDCLGGYGCFSLGHRHPKVVEAVKTQLDSLALSGKAFFNKQGADLAAKLAEIAPEGLQYTFYCNSGAEAVEGALKFAKGVTGRSKIVSTFGGFHGKTLGSLSVTGKEKYRQKFEPLLPGVEFVPYGDSITASEAIDEHTACMIVEAIQGEGGIHVPPDGYLRDLRAACDKVGALLILDEVQTLLGRTGKWFGCDHDGVSPDLMTLAKALGGGVMPIGAVMGTQAVWEKIYGENPLSHTSTFGGNSLACAAGIAAIEVTKEEGLLERSTEMGALLKGGLAEVGQRHGDLIKEVRGRGLMIGVEFQMDEVGELVVAQMLKRGMCVAYTLNNPRVLRFEPPLIIREDQVQFAVETFGEAVSETTEVLAMLA